MALQAALTDALIESMNQYRPLLHGKRIWLACSGGRDSLSLALLCNNLFHNGQIPFLPQLLHVNHGMQAANMDWAHYVKQWADQHEMRCQILNITLDNKSEQAARQARYNTMIHVMNCDDVLMLGHHKNDQVETVLMRLFSGTGIKGLGGMEAWTTKGSETSVTSQDNSKVVHLWRPWLSISRNQITQYAKEVALDYIDDPTNVIDSLSQSIQTSERSIEYKTFLDNIEHPVSANEPTINDRAWLRSRLMPLIDERYPQASDAIYRTSQLVQAASVIVNEHSKTDLDTVLTDNLLNKSIPYQHSIINIERLLAIPKARQSALIHTWLHPTCTELPPSKRLVDDILVLCERHDANHQTLLHWNSGTYHYDIRRYRNNLYRLRQDWLEWLQIPADTQQISLHELQNNDKGLDVVTIKDGPFNIKWQVKGVNKLVSGLDKSSLEDASLVFEPLPRDLKVALQGRVGRKSGKKLLQAMHQPCFMRSSIVLVSFLNSSSNKVPIAIVCLDAMYLLDTSSLKNNASKNSPKLDHLLNNEIVTTVTLI